MPVDPRRIYAVFLAAAGASDAAAQAAILDRECGTDLELRRRAEALLRARLGPTRIPGRQATLTLPGAPAAATATPGAAVGARAGKDTEKTWDDGAAEDPSFNGATGPARQSPPPADSSRTPPESNGGAAEDAGARSVRLPPPAAERDPAGPPPPAPSPDLACTLDRADKPGAPPPGNEFGDNATELKAAAEPLSAENPEGIGTRDGVDLFAPTRRDGSPCPGPGALKGVAVPGYEILEELGRGGMGVVYKARHLGLQRLVALKMILAGAHAGAAYLARFHAEAEAIAQLQHPNIVQIYETGEYEGLAYFSLEFVEGGSLEKRMQEQPATPRVAAELVETLALAMDVAHQRGIVHRDLKPANVLLAVVGGHSAVLHRAPQTTASLPPDHWFRTTIPKIADFGLAKRVNDDAGQTNSGAILGTPCYMAPEQAGGKSREVGPAADVYALGAILYDLLTGRPPFKTGRPIDTLRQVVEQDPVPPRQLEPRVPQDLETICLRCLEKDPARRYATAADLAADLRRFLNDEPILARPTPAWERAWKWGRRRPAVAALLGVSAAALVGMVLLIVWHNVSLRGQLEQARAEERLARQREQEALEGQRLTRAENEGRKRLDDARLAVAARDWANARLRLTEALATIGAEPGLEDVKAPAQALLNQVEQELRAEADRRTSQARLQEFARRRDEAQFLGTLYTGMDVAANRQATRAAVRRALAVYGVSAAEGARPAFDAYLDDSQKAAILGDCYQLLLILAETEAESAPEQRSPERERCLREALRLLDRALRFGPSSRAYHLRRARYLGLLGDRAGAAEAEKAAAAAPVLHVLDRFLVADELYRRARFAEAVAEFDEVLRMKPAHFWAQYLAALCLLRLHRPAEARAQLGACLAQRPDFVWLYLLRGFAQGELNEFGAADADFETAGRMPLDEYARYVLFVDRGVVRVRAGRPAEAVADLQAAITLKPDEYQAYVNLAQAYRLLKQPDLALRQLDRAVRIEPGLAHLYRLRARLHLERKEPALALEDFDQAIRRESTNSPYLADDHAERGRLLLLDGKYPEALASFDAALRLRKDHAPAQRLRAEALFHLGRYQEVVEAFDRYLETGKPLESVYRGRGLALTELGKYPGAIEDFTRALELRPTSAVYAYRGWAHLVCDAPKLALRDFELAIDLDPTNADAYDGRGFAEATQGRPREAVRDAEEALCRGPRSPRLLYNAARVYARCGAPNELRALGLLRQALGLLPAEQRPAFWSRYVRKDPALQALRGYSEFLQLEAELSRRD